MVLDMTSTVGADSMLDNDMNSMSYSLDAGPITVALIMYVPTGTIGKGIFLASKANASLSEVKVKVSKGYRMREALLEAFSSANTLTVTYF